MELTYASYLRIDELLKLQTPRSEPPEHDEMLFIVVHQVYELWFKQLLHELDKTKHNFSNGQLFELLHTFKRCRTIMKIMVSQLDVLETMTPMSFNTFRDRLDKASGFQSMQFREFEFVLGAKRAEILKHYSDELYGLDRAKKRLQERTIIDHFYDFVEQHGVVIPDDLRRRPVEEAAQTNEVVQDGLHKLFVSDPQMAGLFELMLDFDEGQQEWRYRHVKMVERTIGNKRGTGGSLGIEFLKKTLFKPVFGDLWAIRHRL